VRRLLAALTLAAVLPAAGACSGEAANADRAAPKPSAPGPSIAPAAAAGGACQLLDFAAIKSALGLDFTVAAAAQHETTYTCVAQRHGASLPDLVLSVTPTASDASIYTSTIQPKGAKAVAGLGKVGFSLTLAAAGSAGSGGAVGPGVQVGWLAGNGRIIDLKVHLATTATPDEALAAVPHVIGLAKTIDLSSL
jgi:hypothetical protein